MIAVTTHSGVKRLRYTLRMLHAGWQIQHELRDAPGCARSAQVLAGPRELWTLTLWQDAAQLRSCMRDGTHGRVMLQQPYWLDSYWGMRWQGGGHRHGVWEGAPVAWLEPGEGELGRQHAGLGRQHAGSGRDHAAPGSSPDQSPASGTLPLWMQAALGRTVPLEQRQVAGVSGAAYRLRVPLWRFPSALPALLRVRRAAAADPGSFRLSAGLGTDGALYLLVVVTSRDALDRLQRSPAHRRLVARWGRQLWWSSWEADAEFGHWERHKLRDGQLAEAPLVVDVSLPVAPDSPQRARDALRRGLPVLDESSLDALELLMSELVANDVRHAEPAAGGWIRLQVRAEGDWVRVAVADRGRRFEPYVPRDKSYDDESGWGLYIIDQTAQRWGITEAQQERSVWFELHVPVVSNAVEGTA